MTTIQSKYTGDLRTEAIHIASGTIINTDAPVDNKGRGEYFSPTDLVAAALGSCMVTIIGIAAKEQQFSIDGATWEITKIMSSDPPRRISGIEIHLTLPHNRYTEAQHRIIEYAVKNCPVALSLHPELKQTVNISWLSS